MCGCVRPVSFAAQAALVAAALMPGVEQPAKGAMLLASFWFWGVRIGSLLYGKRRGGESAA